MFKIGDVITRRDMPAMVCEITGNSKEWDAWEAKSMGSTRGRLGAGLVFKDDNRWVIVHRDKE